MKEVKIEQDEPGDCITVKDRGEMVALIQDNEDDDGIDVIVVTKKHLTRFIAALQQLQSPNH